MTAADEHQWQIVKDFILTLCNLDLADSKTTTYGFGNLKSMRSHVASWKKAQRW